jgi:hypothetical protein
MFHFQGKMDFGNLTNLGAFKSLLKYILCYEMTWKFVFMVHRYGIKIWLVHINVIH